MTNTSHVPTTRYSVRTEESYGVWTTKFQGTAAEVRAYLVASYPDPAGAMKRNAVRIYGGENGARARLPVTRLQRAGVIPY